ncbi:MAG: hypothetical protein H6587_03310 [Flavobacteriales bacterium]|nr:hypothetical protein [Flavobacteriales bacterium]MCB9363576.1 hypothetical protein [Flavobacteriales bacterium]
MTKKVNILIYIWVANLLFVALILFTNLSIKPFRLIYFQITFILAGLPLIQWYKRKTYKSGIIAGITTLLFSAGIMYYALILDWRGPWKTQTVYYQNNNFTNRTIEFQMQDIGAFGYNRRTIDKFKLLPFLEWTKEIELKEVDTLNWKKVDIYKNELKLKGG